MNYLREILTFENWIEYNSQVNKSDIRLWYTLIHTANRFSWKEFAIPISTLIFKSKLSKSDIYRARNKLKQFGLIDFKERGNQATIYKMNSCVSLFGIQIETTSATLNATSGDTPDGIAGGANLGNINKTKNQKLKTKRNIVTHNGVTHPNDDKEIALFNDFWEVYPKKVGKKEALKAFSNIKNLDQQLLDDILLGIKKWQNSDQWREANRKFIPYPSTFLNSERWKDEVIITSSQSKNQKESEYFRNDSSAQKWLEQAEKSGY